ncbi:MAG: hypothetical protein LBT75_04730 [Bacilli bacterium]|jgi:hypothetical protein|nr:hypothetical protein [Bacilli bacterium]
MDRILVYQDKVIINHFDIERDHYMNFVTIYNLTTKKELNIKVANNVLSTVVVDDKLYVLCSSLHNVNENKLEIYDSNNNFKLLDSINVRHGLKKDLTQSEALIELK